MFDIIVLNTFGWNSLKNFKIGGYMAYLYGASVQGIQDFIFKTNKLQEIVGASEIVKGIKEEFSGKYSPKEVLINAAGNIKAVFDKTECEHVVLEFPKHIMQIAYGITISQAVIPIEGETPTQEELNSLEKKLKVQRNKPTTPLDMSLGVMKLNPSTARPLVKDKIDGEKTQLTDRATKQKLTANTNFFNNNANIRDLKDLSKMSNGKNKIAVIHADGNGLGMLLPKLKDLGLKLSDFSKKLDTATQNAFDRAKNNDSMRVRDVILGGDDMVVICDANDALEFTKNYLAFFEEETQKEIGHRLTACAGIAYMNEKYPFHYAIGLAEDLCSQTKKHAKKINAEMAPSSLMFHNIQGSNYQNWKKFVKDELTLENDKRKVRFDFGPYYLEEVNQPQIKTFMEITKLYKQDDSPIAKLRSWIGELHKSDEYAERMLSRLNDMAKQNSAWEDDDMNEKLALLYKDLSNSSLIVEKDKDDKDVVLLKTPIYDILQILSATEVK